MRVVRRASLIFSLILIVAIAVGYVARRVEMAGQRDQALAAAAEVGASNMSAVVGAIEIAAGSGTDPTLTAAALVAEHPELGVCVVDAEDDSCAGDGPQPSSADVAARRVERAAGAAVRGAATVNGYESLIIIQDVGPAVSVVAQLPADAVVDRGEISVYATTFVPVGTG